MILHIGDSQIDQKEPNRSGILKFWDWVYDTYPEAKLVHGGDIFEKASHDHRLIEAIQSRLRKFKEVHIVPGNHDHSKQLNFIVKPFASHDNIFVYDTVQEFEIDGIRFLALPHNGYKEKVYEEITEVNNIDYSICHFTPLQEAFGEEGVELKFKVNVAHIFNHIHRHRVFTDNFGNQVLIAGSIASIKSDEVAFEKNIYSLEKDKWSKIKVPQFYTYEKIKYGDFPQNKNNILNIYDAPSMQAVRDTYKDFYIREEGVEILRTRDNSKLIKADGTKINKDNMLELFNQYNLEEANLSKEVNQCCSTLLQKIN